MKAVAENFGLIQARIATPYTNLMKHYFNCDWDIVGLYYPGSNGLELLLYDAYTSYRIREVSILGQLLLWESVIEISTKKFYCETASLELDEAIASVIVSGSPQDLEEAIADAVLYGGTVTRIASNRDWFESELHINYRPTILEAFESKIREFGARQSTESVYKRTTAGIKCPQLDQEYDVLHDKLFEVLKRLNKDSQDILRSKPRISEPVQDHPLINKLYHCLERNKAGVAEALTVTHHDLDLGEHPFRLALPVHYNPCGEKDKKLELKCLNFSTVLPSCYPDLSFLDKQVLVELLKYISASNEDAFGGLESDIITELSKRSNFL